MVLLDGLSFMYNNLLEFLGTLNDFFVEFSFVVLRVVSCVQSNPILLLTFGLFILGGAIGIFGRIFSRD